MAILYLLDFTRYALGIRTLFKKKLRRLWVPIIMELVCLIVMYICEDNNKLLDEILISIYFLSVLSVFIMIERKLKDRLLYILGLFAMFACLDELIGVFLTKIISELVYKSILECVGSIVILTSIFIFQRIKITIHIKRIWFTLFTIFASACVAFMMFVLSGVEDIQKFSGETLYKVMILIGYGCLIGVIAVALYTKEINQKEQEILKMEKNINEMQKKYYLSLLEREADTRRYRHDINNHFMCLREMIHGNSEAQNYIDKLQEQLYDIKRKNYETGSEILNILLSNHLSGISKDIPVSIIGRVTSQPDINDVDFCIIFSNLLNNAVEEVERTVCLVPYIKIEIKTGSLYLMITIKNSSTALIEKEELKVPTKKQDKKNHGMGLKNVRETIERNRGSFSLEGNGEEVSAKVMLNLKN